MAATTSNIGLKLAKNAVITSQDGFKHYVLTGEKEYTFCFPVGTALKGLSTDEFFLTNDKTDILPTSRGPYAIELQKDTTMKPIDWNCHMALNESTNFLLTEKTRVIVPKGTALLINGVFVEVRKDTEMSLACNTKMHTIDLEKLIREMIVFPK